MSPTGYGYVTWAQTTALSGPDKVFVCKLPANGVCSHRQELGLPAHASSESDVTQPFPVLGFDGAHVYIVGPRYVDNDILTWTSVNDGSFGAPSTYVPYADGTGVGNVVTSPYMPRGAFLVASSNPPLGVTYIDPQSAGTSYVHTFNAPGLESTAVGYDGFTTDLGTSDTVAVFSTDETSDRIGYYVSKNSNFSAHLHWQGPYFLGAGADPLVASGIGGMYLLYLVTNADGSGALEVRKWSLGTDSFQAATVLANIPQANSSDIGAVGESGQGEVDVAWPVSTSSGGMDMELWSMPRGGSFSGPADVATVRGTYGGPAYVTSGNKSVTGLGHVGFLTFQDSRGLELVDLWATTSTASPPGRHKS